MCCHLNEISLFIYLFFRMPELENFELRSILIKLIYVVLLLKKYNKIIVVSIKRPIVVCSICAIKSSNWKIFLLVISFEQNKNCQLFSKLSIFCLKKRPQMKLFILIDFSNKIRFINIYCSFIHVVVRNSSGKQWMQVDNSKKFLVSVKIQELTWRKAYITEYPHKHV